MEIQKMNPEVKALWLEALRSGEYQQTKETLRDDAGFCCLGVLCDLHSKVTGNGEWDGADYCFGYATAGEREEAIPTTSVIEWAGLKQRNPDVMEEEVFSDSGNFICTRDRSIAQLNDDGKSFEEIADIIEEVL